jgi:hypothetical protein
LESLKVSDKHINSLIDAKLSSIESRKVDVLRRATMYPDGLDGNYYGYAAVNTAASYYFARATGLDSFVYSNASLFSDDDGYNDADGAADRWVRNADGKARMDCSTYMGLALRGIPYEKSPFATHTEPMDKWIPSEELPDMYGTEGWEFRLLDKQPYDVYSGIGINGYSTIRFAADFAEFFYKYGYVVYDSQVDGSPTTDLVNLLEPGDLLFWSDLSEGDGRAASFRGVTHIGMVAQNTSKYYEVVNTSNVVNYDNFSDDYSKLVLICRPNYNVNGDRNGFNVNLLSYPWVYSTARLYSVNGLDIEASDIHTLEIHGTATATTSLRLIGNDNGGACLQLAPGTYRLSGLDGSAYQSTSFALQVRYANGNDIYVKPDGMTSPVPIYVDADGNETTESTGNTLITSTIRAYDGHHAEFTFSEETAVQIRLYIGEGVSPKADKYTLSLVRIA